MQISADDVKAGLECYDPEGSIFPRLREGAGVKELTARHVLLILRWKLGRIKEAHARTVSPGNLAKINSALVLAGQLERAPEALEALMTIEEIGLAVATVLLTVRYPDSYTIIDWRVLEALRLQPATTDRWTAADYVSEFLPAVQNFRKRHSHLSLRQADQALWGISLNTRIERLIEGASTASSMPADSQVSNAR